MKKHKCKILNPILHCQHPLYDGIASCSRKTWLSNKHNDVFSFFYFGSQNLDQNKIDGDKLFLKCLDRWPQGGLAYVSTNKMLMALEFCLDNFDFDFLLRTSSSTYVNYNSLVDFTNKLPDDFAYGGALGKKNFPPKHQAVRYALGHAVLMSKHFIEHVVEKKDLIISYDLVDDAALGKFVKENDIPITNFGHNSDFCKWFLGVDDVKKCKKIPTLSRCKPLGEKTKNHNNWLTHTCELFNVIHKRLS